jgi:uracil-DNA glycosylase family 4
VVDLFNDFNNYIWVSRRSYTMVDVVGLSLLADKVDKCKKCSLYAGCRGKVFGDIGPNTQVVFVGQCPGEDEDLAGRPFVGKSGQLLRKWIKSAGLTDDQISIVNILKCYIPNNRDPIESEKQACSEWIDRQVDLIGCKKLVLLGRVACDHFLSGSGIFDGSILKHVGNVYPVDGRQFLVFPHPSFVLRGGEHYEVPVDKLKNFGGK